MRKFERNFYKRLASEAFQDYVLGDLDIMSEYLTYSDEEEKYLSYGGNENYYWDNDYCYRGSDGYYHYAEDSSDILSSSVASYIDRAEFEDMTWGSVISARNVFHGLRYVKSYVEAERIQRLYEKAISRTSDYRGNIYGHILSRNGIVYEPTKGNYLVGYELEGHFIVSHFAPKNIVSGVKMMKDLLQSELPVVIATLPYQANQLIKIGFKAVAEVPQYWHGEIHMKTVCVNEAANSSKIRQILQYNLEWRFS